MQDIQQNLDTFKANQARLTGSLPKPERPWKNSSEAIQSRGILLYGPRGTGKTTWMLRRAKISSGIYLNMDHPLISLRPLIDWVEALFQRGIKSVFLDEINYAGDWSRNLKVLYDVWPDCTICASGSNSLLLSSGMADLSRRFIGINMPFLSFREYLVLKGYPDFGIKDPFSAETSWTDAVINSLPVLKLFESYLKAGLRPVFTENEKDYPVKIIQVARKTIEADIPYIVAHLGTNHFRLMNAVLGYLSSAPIPVLQVNSLCREWNLGKEKLYSLLHAMEETGLIRIIRRPNDHAAMSIGSKIFLADPSMYAALSGQEGNAREAFTACAVVSSGKTLHAAVNEANADFIIDNSLSVEVGGARKKRKNADIVIRDGIDYPAPGIVPLWTLGFGW